jgi:hypothetical protein
MTFDEHQGEEPFRCPRTHRRRAMYHPGEFPHFFLPHDREFGVEIPVTRRGKPKGRCGRRGSASP